MSIYFELLFIHLFYDNILLNNNLKSNEYLFLNVILKLRDTESNNIFLRLVDILKML